MNYPIELLPNEKYKIIDCKIDNLYLARTFKIIGDFPVINPDSGNIQIKYVADPTKHIADFSTNLLGIFEPRHLSISLNDEGKIEFNHYCSPEEKVDVPIFNKHFIVEADINYFSILISDIQNQKIPYYLGDDLVLGTCRIEHTPMKWNFWHFSIRWVNNNGDYLHNQKDNKFKSGWTKQLSSAAKALIVQYAKVNEPNYFVIPARCYSKEFVTPIKSVAIL